MTLRESNLLLEELDCRDTDAVTAALTERARAIAEFAASAPQDVLNETLTAGEAFRDRLEMAQVEARRELNRMTRLTRGLESTLSERENDHIQCFG
jgi:hypothetical protein